MSKIQVPNEDLKSWLAELKPFQRSTLEHFMESMGAEAAAERWLSTIGTPNLVGFGGAGVTDPKPFLERFKTEFHKFLCDDNAYSDEKKEITGQMPISKTVLISMISSAIGAHMGTAGTLIAPAVTLFLFTIGKMGINAYCSK
jgi:hypothetical protein